MKKSGWYYLLTALGVGLLAGGLYAVRAVTSDAAAPYLCIGCGCGIFGHGLGELIRRRALKNTPEVAAQQAVEETDERNVLLRDRSQARAYRLMLPVFGALFVAFGLMGVEMRVVLLLVAAYLFVCGSSVYYRVKYERED